MKYGNLIFTQRDLELMQLVLLNWNNSSELSEANFKLLSTELKHVKVYPEDEIPKDVVRFGSFIDIDTPIGLLTGYEIVVPVKRDPSQKKLSVLSPIGSAVIGYAEGDEVNWNFPLGQRVIKIKKVVNNLSISAL